MKAVTRSASSCADGFARKELIWAGRWVVLPILTPFTVSRARCRGGTLLPAVPASPPPVPAVLSHLGERRWCFSLPSPGEAIAAPAASGTAQSPACAAS